MTAAGVETVRTIARTVWASSPEVLRPIEEAFGVAIGQRLDDDGIWASLAYPPEQT